MKIFVFITGFLFISFSVLAQEGNLVKPDSAKPAEQVSTGETTPEQNQPEPVTSEMNTEVPVIAVPTPETPVTPEPVITPAPVVAPEGPLVVQNEVVTPTQTEEKRLKPVAKNWGMTFNITGLIDDFRLEGNKDMNGQPILFFKRYLKDDLALRLGFGLNTIKNTSTKKDSVRLLSAFVEFDSIYARNDVSFSFGVEKHLDHMRRLDPYFGGELLIDFIGKETISWTQVTNETAGKTTLEGERKTDGGLGIGVFAIAGFNYFITDHMSLGAEYRFGYASVKTGGNFSESIIVTPASGSPSNIYNKGTDLSKSSGFEVNSSANVVFSIFF